VPELQQQATGRDDYRTISVLITGYLAIQFAANLTVVKTTSIIGGHPIPIGSLLYAINFTWIDLVNEHLGRRRARWLVALSVSANALLILWFQLYIALPGTSEWNTHPDHQTAINFVMGTTPRILVASLLTTYISENIDILIYHRLRSRISVSARWLTSASSNTVSAPVDGIVFALLAFAGTVSGSFLLSLMLTSALYKLTVAYISLPLNYVIFQTRRRVVNEAK
jgi:uncharacterized integral membrane protein (TIGR00697 family)